MSTGTEILHERAPFTGAAFQFGDTTGRQGLEIVVPPIKPAPEERRKEPRRQDRQEDIEALSGFHRLGQVLEQEFGLLLEHGRTDVAVGQGTIQRAQFVEHDTASDENGNLGCAQEKGRILLRIDLRQLEFRFHAGWAMGTPFLLADL